jgi:tRNA-specific 2-thiouridylase
MKKIKVVVAMSGGVDSSVSAALLKKAGYDVIGIFLKFWKEPSVCDVENKCCSTDAAEVARRVAQKLEIPFYVLNFEKDFKKEVVDYFLAEYRAGRTPNPCVKCNQFIKFGKLLEKTRELGADFLATGHYIKVKSSNLYEGKDKQKDQSYFLWALKKEQLKHLIFPVGNYTKTEVRKLAEKFDLPSAHRQESQEICFVYSTLIDFLKNYIKPRKGKIVDLKGKILGNHDGAVFYTIGQRQNLNINPSNPKQKPFYVIRTDVKKNLVIIGEDKNLYSKKLTAIDVNWFGKEIKKGQILKCLARIRYGHPKEKCSIKFLTNKKLKVEFEKAQRAITPGQSIVFYDDEKVLGGGIIE